MAPFTPSLASALAASALVALLGAISDLRTRRIPNRLTGPAILAGILMHFALNGWRGLGSAAAAGAVAGAIFLVFFIAGGMGAGDVKLMTAVGCMAGLHSIAEILIMTSLVGGVFAVAVAIVRGRLRSTLTNVMVLAVHHRTAGLEPHPELNVANSSTLRLPYGIAIAVGCLVTLATQLYRG